MGTTPAFGLRYPEPTDKVADGALAIRNLAEDVEADLGTLLPKTGKAADSELLDGLDSLAFLRHALADAKGDLLAGSGVDAVARLPVGADGQVLTADAAAALGIKWAAAPPLSSGAASIATRESTTSTSFTDLATIGPAATVTIGASGRALVLLGALTDHNTAPAHSVVAFAVSGATAIAPSDAMSLAHLTTNVNIPNRTGIPLLVTGLAAGATTFTAKYRTSVSGTASFSDRHLIVIPL